MNSQKEVLIKQYSEAFKLKVVHEYEHEGMSSHELSLQYGISKGSVMNWVRKFGQYDRRIKRVRVSMTSESKKIRDLQELLAESELKNRFLESLVETANEEMGVDLKKTFGTDVYKKKQKKDKGEESQ